MQANSTALDDDVLFEVNDKAGDPVFRVTSSGVRIYIKDKGSKAVSGGFAVGQYGSLKTDGDEFFVVTPFTTRVNLLPSGKANSGGFAVGQYASLKGGLVTPNFYTNPVETRIYTGGSLAPEKAVSGGFAVGQYGSLKGADDYMHMTPDNYFIGHSAGLNTTPASPLGINNLFFGYESGLTNTTGHENTYIGHNSGRINSAGIENTFLGVNSGSNSPSGSSNVFVGVKAGQYQSTGGNNIYVGNLAHQATEDDLIFCRRE